MALLSADLGMLRQRLANASEEIQDHVARLATETAGIGCDVHRIARGLHPAALEQLGLEASIRRYCAQLAEAGWIRVDLELSEVPAALDPNAALCLYRIAQEALFNVVKHSGASHATVSLTAVRGDLVLRIVDRGVGFDSQALRLKDTLGLLSMRERARLVHAQLLVSSKPGGGTVDRGPRAHPAIICLRLFSSKSMFERNNDTSSEPTRSTSESAGSERQIVHCSQTRVREFSWQTTTRAF